MKYFDSTRAIRHLERNSFVFFCFFFQRHWVPLGSRPCDRVGLGGVSKLFVFVVNAICGLTRAASLPLSTFTSRPFFRSPSSPPLYSRWIFILSLSLSLPVFSFPILWPILLAPPALQQLLSLLSSIRAVAIVVVFFLLSFFFCSVAHSPPFPISVRPIFQIGSCISWCWAYQRGIE